VTTAPLADQWRLLDVQALDTRLDQLAHRRRTLPEHARLAELEASHRELSDEVVRARTATSDLQRELTKAERDVELVVQRSARDQSRLDSGTGSAKDLTALQHEVETLARRQSALEDVELEVMERLETARAELDRASASEQQLSAELEAVRAALEAATSALDEEAERVRAERADAAAGLDEALLRLYEKVRENSGGTGAAVLRGRRCEGCHLELPPQDLQRIRNAPPEEVVRCEECRRILVRTADSAV
jgi:uncharacterized protein